MRLWPSCSAPAKGDAVEYGHIVTDDRSGVNNCAKPPMHYPKTRANFHSGGDLNALQGQELTGTAATS